MVRKSKRITRFAPSPTGLLHLGHAYSALISTACSDLFLLRIEDIDTPRCRREYEVQIYDDLAWLGLKWEQPVIHQSERHTAYKAALKVLANKGLTYYCTCTRGDIRAALSAPQEETIPSFNGIIYPGTCRTKHHTQGSIRLNMEAAMKYLGNNPIYFNETGPRYMGQHLCETTQMQNTIGDVVLARQDIGCSYHLAVVVDDAAQGITDVTRGEDLFQTTSIHVLLQRLLDLPTPIYHHHSLIRDSSGKRLAKRDDAHAISLFRQEGLSPQDLKQKLGL